MSRRSQKLWSLTTLGRQSLISLLVFTYTYVWMVYGLVWLQDVYQKHVLNTLDDVFLKYVNQFDHG